MCGSIVFQIQSHNWLLVYLGSVDTSLEYDRRENLPFIFSDLCNHFMLTLYIDHQEDTLNLALVQYYIDEEEHKVIPRAHANSKQSESCVCMMPSTFKILKDVMKF